MSSAALGTLRGPLARLLPLLRQARDEKAKTSDQWLVARLDDAYMSLRELLPDIRVAAASVSWSVPEGLRLDREAPL